MGKIEFEKGEELKEYILKDINEIKIYIDKTQNVKEYHNQLYLETGKEDIKYYEENNNIYYKEDKLEQTGYKVPAETILQSKVRPYLKNFLQIKNDDLVISKAFLKFYNSNPLINELVFLIFNSGQYHNFIINNQNTEGQKPEIEEKTWNNFSFKFIDLNDENKVKYYISKIKKEYSIIDKKIDILESMKLLLNHKKELILEKIF